MERYDNNTYRAVQAVLEHEFKYVLEVRDVIVEASTSPLYQNRVMRL